VVIGWKSRVRWNGKGGQGGRGQGARKFIKPIIAKDLIFSAKCINDIWRPGSARTRWRSLKTSASPLAAVEAREEHTLNNSRTAVRGALRRGGCGGSTWKGAEMNENGYFETRHRQRFHLHVKMYVWRSISARNPLRELKRSPDFIFGP